MAASLALDDPTRHESLRLDPVACRARAVVVRGHARSARWNCELSMHSYGAMFCEVAVNCITGRDAGRAASSGRSDCGRILNAKTATSQFRGGIIMGFGPRV